VRRASAALSSTGQTAAHLVDNGKRVLDIDLQRCPNCGASQPKITAAIRERPVIETILTPLGLDPKPPPMGGAGEAGQDFAAT
jgi:hypothetical protein